MVCIDFVLFFRTIGVVGVDATLDQIENFLTKHQWGNVYSFLINKEGETIYHPKLKPSTNVSFLWIIFLWIFLMH